MLISPTTSRDIFSRLYQDYLFSSAIFDLILLIKPITTRTEDEWIDGVAPDCETQWTQLCDIANWKLKTIHKKLIKWQRSANCDDIDLESKAAWSKCMCLTIRYNDTVFTENTQTHRWPISKHNTMPFSYRFDHYPVYSKNTLIMKKNKDLITIF